MATTRDNCTVDNCTLTDLTELLHEQEWQAADQITLWLLLQATNRTAEGWLDTDAVARIPCTTLEQIDQLWVSASQGRFGFSVQRQIYEEVANLDALELSQQLGWLLFGLRPLAFFKFYDFLTFDLSAPHGHLPALWYWTLPWPLSWQKGGFGTGRGAGFGDASLLDAMMLRLDRCQMIQP